MARSLPDHEIQLAFHGNEFKTVTTEYELIQEESEEINDLMKEVTK